MDHRSDLVWRRGVVGALTIVLLVLVGTSPAAAQAADGYGPFVDTDGSVHEAGVIAIWDAGLTNGCADWRYCPHGSVTRAQLAAFLTRALVLPAAPVSGFSDVGGHPLAGEIGALEAGGLAIECQPGLFCPDRAVTRAEMAGFLATALQLPEASGPDRFTDDEGSPYEGDIDVIAEAGISSGCGGSRYCPHGAVTRAEMATLLTRALGLPVPDVLPAIPTDAEVSYRLETSPSETGAESWRWLVEIFFRPADVDRAVRIIACESLGDPDAVNPSSGASGLFQHIPRYWPERSSQAGHAGESIFDPEANVAVAAWLVYHDGGWGHWVCSG